MRNYRIIYAVVAVLVLFGIFALGQMKKDEFPQVTIRQGLVVAVFPGATAQEVEEQVAKPILYLQGERQTQDIQFEQGRNVLYLRRPFAQSDEQ